MKSNRDLDNRYGAQGYSKYGRGYQEDKHKLEEAIKQRAKETVNASHRGYRTMEVIEREKIENARKFEEQEREKAIHIQEQTKINALKFKEALSKALKTSNQLKDAQELQQEGRELKLLADRVGESKEKKLHIILLSMT